MLRCSSPEQDGVDTNKTTPERGRRRSSSSSEDQYPNQLLIPKNKSTGNLLQYVVRTGEREKGRIRFSFDAGESNPMSRASLLTDHDHELGLSGLIPIRQHPPARFSTIPSASSSRAPSVGPRSGSMHTTAESRKSSIAFSTRPSSPTMNFTDDRFSTEPLHSFSFAPQSSDESVLHRQNVLKKSLEFMSKTGNRPGVSPAAQARAQPLATVISSRPVNSGQPSPSLISPLLSGTASPLNQSSSAQSQAPSSKEPDSPPLSPTTEVSHASALASQLKDAAFKAVTRVVGNDGSNEATPTPPPPAETEPPAKKTIDDFVILEEMGQGAYGQVKLARYKKTGEKVVLKFVTKRRILVDTWTRDRRLGTVPLEIHVLDYLRRNDLKHSNIVEMIDFFEDDVNYYIEMIPHGLPGMDLFDYIELRVDMDEAEARAIFLQVAKAIHHLHTKANVVHRDIKDENVILDGETNIKLIDFGSAAYIKSGPFDVFVGTIDYAAPEVLAGKPYNGKEQDVWALGILLYTIIYKENPFYSIDEIMDHDLRVPYILSEESIDLIRKMLDRDVSQRLDIQQVLDHPWLKEHTEVHANGTESESG